MFLSVNETIQKINAGTFLHIAADDGLLSQLPKGNWIGGTTPYFITNEGGIVTKEKLFVTELSDALQYKVTMYDEKNITTVCDNAYENGVTLLLIPFGSQAAAVYFKEAPNLEKLFLAPVVGWVTGYDLQTGGQAKVYNGLTGEAFADKAVALSLELPKEKAADIAIVNIFDVNETLSLQFEDGDGEEITTCTVNGKKVNLAEFLEENKLDTKLPLIADYNGVKVNVSIKSVDNEKKIVYLYAPVFAGETYYFAKPVADYENAFRQQLASLKEEQPRFSCNCILNFLYGNLEGKATPPFEGPVTFGEVAYQLLNQTLVYLNY